MTPIKLQALVYDILPSTTAVFSYAIGSRKLSANEQFFVGAQTTQIKQGMPFIASNKESLHQHKQNHNCLNREGTLLLPGVDASRVYVSACLGAGLLLESY